MKEWRSEGIRKEGRVISLSSRGILASGTAWSRDSKLSLGQDWFSLIFQLCSFRADSIYSQSLHWRREQQRKLIVNPQLFPLCFLYHKTSHLWLGTASWGKDRLSIPLLQLNMVVWPMAHKWKKRHEQFSESCPWWVLFTISLFPTAWKLKHLSGTIRVIRNDRAREKPHSAGHGGTTQPPWIAYCRLHSCKKKYTCILFKLL